MDRKKGISPIIGGIGRRQVGLIPVVLLKSERPQPGDDRMISFLAKMVLVGIIHFAIGVSFYYQRITHRSLLFDSDVIVFLVPTISAFGGYFAVTWFCGFLRQQRITRITTAALIALAATAISSICVATFAFNRFGT
jgi:hypothetical protein